MGILANSVSLCHYRIVGQLPAGDQMTWVGERLAAKGFRSIDHGAEELSVGWVELDDPQQSDFGNPDSYQRDHWLTFSLRRDQRRVPAGLLRAHMELAVREFLGRNPGLQRVPKGKRDELKEAVHGALLARTLPVPSVYDALWDTRLGIVSFAALSPKATELFETLFKQTFDGLHLVPLAPYRRAEGILTPPLQGALQQANQATGDGILELLRDNRWIGEDFLLWLLFRTLHASGEYAVSCPGPAAAGEVFAAYLNDRMVLQGEGGAGVQKMTVSGPQDSFDEVRAALRGGKKLREAVICFEKQEHAWRLNLKGETFALASYKAPAVRLEKDDLTDPLRERQALFFERMHVIEEGLQLFDSLFAAFLQSRLGGEWPQLEGRISSWLAGD